MKSIIESISGGRKEIRSDEKEIPTCVKSSLKHR